MPRMLAKLRPPPLCATLAAPDQQAVGMLIGVANEYLRVLGLQPVDREHNVSHHIDGALIDLAAARKAFAAAGADSWAEWTSHPIALLDAALRKLPARDLDRMGVVS